MEDDSCTNCKELGYKLSTLVKCGDIPCIAETLDEAPATESIKQNGWQILTSLVDSCFDEKFSQSQIDAFDHVVKHIVALSNQKEILFALLESCEAFKSTSVFVILLPHLTEVIKSFTPTKASLDIVLETLYNHTKTIVWLDKSYELIESPESPTRLQVNNEQVISDLLKCLEVIVCQFLRPVISHWKLHQTSNEHGLLTNFIVKLLHFPLLYLFTESLNETLHRSKLTLIECFTKLHPTLTSILEPSPEVFNLGAMHQRPDIKATQENSPTPGVANLIYLVLCENYNIPVFPQVYEHNYRLSLLLPYVNSLCIRSCNAIVTFKALTLIRFLFDGLNNNQLSEHFVEIAQFRSLITYFHWCMQYSELETLRKCAASLLVVLIKKITPKGQCMIYNWILETEENPDVLSHTYTLIKNWIHALWNEHTNIPKELESSCSSLLGKIFTVPSASQQGEIIADLNKISSALNLALYVALRDTKRVSPIANKMSFYIRGYIEPIGHCLKAELDALKKHMNDINSGVFSSESNIDFSVGNESYSNNTKMEKEMTEAAICKLELVIYTHHRLTDALNQ